MYGRRRDRHTKLISFTEPHLLRQKPHTFFLTLILRVGAVAVLLRRAADAVAQRLRQQRHGRLCGVGRELLGRGLEEVIEGPLPVLEAGVVLRDLTFGVVRVPGADLDGDDEVEGGEVELESLDSSLAFCLGIWDRKIHLVKAETTFMFAAKWTTS